MHTWFEFMLSLCQILPRCKIVGQHVQGIHEQLAIQLDIWHIIYFESAMPDLRHLVLRSALPAVQNVSKCKRNEVCGHSAVITESCWSRL